jgi:hypothetical protein
MNDISADNYKEILKQVDSSLFPANIDGVLSEDFSLTFSHEYATLNDSEHYNHTVTNEKTDKGNIVTIHSKKTNLVYNMIFHDGEIVNIWIHLYGFMDPNSQPTPQIKAMINDLVLKNGFLLLRSKMKNGSDIIIKEADKCFIIGNFYSYDDQPFTSNIRISAYSKNKYFHFFRN